MSEWVGVWPRIDRDTYTQNITVLIISERKESVETPIPNDIIGVRVLWLNDNADIIVLWLNDNADIICVRVLWPNDNTDINDNADIVMT